MASCKTIGWAGAPKFHSKSMRSMVREHAESSQVNDALFSSKPEVAHEQGMVVWYEYQSEVLKLGSMCSGSCLGCRCLPLLRIC